MSDFLDEYGHIIITVIIAAIVVNSLCNILGYSGNIPEIFQNHIKSITGG